MTNLQTRHLEGLVTTSGAAPLRAIAIPLLPQEGAWSITGQLIGAIAATPRHAVTFYPQFSGVCEGGVVTLSTTPSTTTPSTTPKTKSQPTESCRPQTAAPGGPALVVTGHQVEIELTGLENTTIVWAWSFDVLVLALPPHAPSDKPRCTVA